MRASAFASWRNLSGPTLASLFDVKVTGAHRVPDRGGVLLVANHSGLLDAALLSVCGPRPVRVVTEEGSAPVLWSRLRPVSGRIIVEYGRPRAAMREAVDAAVSGAAVGIFPEGSLPTETGEPGRLRGVLPGAAYVQARAGIPVVCVALLGTHGRRPTDPPVARSGVDMVFGEPFTPDPPTDPFRAAALRDVSEQIRQRLADHLEVCVARTGRAPGPAAPARERENGRS